MKLSPWVFALIISCSLSYGQYGKDFEEMSQIEKIMMYEQFKKSPVSAISLSFFPMGSYIYTENIGRGLLISIPKTILFIISYGPLYKNGNIDKYLAISEITSKIGILLQTFEIYDAYKLTKKYNNRVYKDIFGKEPPSFSLNLQPTYQGANLTLAYKFD